MTDDEKLEKAAEKAAKDAAKRAKELELDDVKARMDGLESKVSSVADSLEKVSGLLERVIAVSDHKPPKLEVEPEADDTDDSGYFPPKFRRIIDKMLGPDFKATLMESSGGDCVLQVLIPPQWDCRQGEEKLMSKQDIRCGLVHKATDISDLEKWCSLFVTNIKKTYPHFQSNK